VVESAVGLDTRGGRVEAVNTASTWEQKGSTDCMLGFERFQVVRMQQRTKAP